MQKKLENELYNRFPKLFSGKDLPITESLMPFGIETGDGWYDLIYTLCEELEKVVKDDFRFSQVKEKYGTLRVYSNYSPEEAEKLIDKAEKDSEFICEKCGKPGLCTELESKWIVTRCDECLNI